MSLADTRYHEGWTDGYEDGMKAGYDDGYADAKRVFEDEIAELRLQVRRLLSPPSPERLDREHVHHEHEQGEHDDGQDLGHGLHLTNVGAA